MNDLERHASADRSHSANHDPPDQNQPAALTEPEGEHWISSAIAEFESPLLRYAQHFVRDIEAARDVVQDTFLQLCRHSNDDIRGRLAQWLYTVCRNRAIDVIRKESRMKPMTDTATDPDGKTNSMLEPTDQGPAPGQLAEQSEQELGLLQQIRRLPDRQQEVLRLKFHGGLSYKEIAEVMGLTSTNVGFILHTAISKLRQRMAHST